MGIHLLIGHLLVSLLSHGSKRSYTVKLQSAVNGLQRLFYTVAPFGPQSLTNGVQVPLGRSKRGIPPYPPKSRSPRDNRERSDWLIESLYKTVMFSATHSYSFVLWQCGGVEDLQAWLLRNRCYNKSVLSVRESSISGL